MQKKLQSIQQETSLYYIPSFLQSTPVAVLTVAVLYFLCSVLSFPINTNLNTISVFFPGLGFGLAATILLGRKAIMGVWLGAFVSTTVMFMLKLAGGNLSGFVLLAPLLVSFSVATATALSLMAGLYLMRVFNVGSYPMKTGKSSLMFTLVCLLISLIRPTIGTATLLFTGNTPGNNDMYAWGVWWRSDVIGIIMITPFVLSWLYKHHLKEKETTASILEKAVLVLAVVPVCIYVFKTKSHNEFMAIAILFWAAYRYGMRGATSVSVIMSACAIYFTSVGDGPFFHDPDFTPVALLQILIFTNIAYSLFLAAILSERKLAEIELKKQADILNERVKELKCLYHISEIAKREELSKQEMIQLCIPEIIKGFQFPEIIACRIILRGEEFSSENFAMTPWFLHHKIIIEGNTLGSIEVCYLKKPNNDGELFLEEEVVLMKSISDIIGKSIEGKIAVRKLIENQNILQSTIESPKGVSIYAIDKKYRYISFNQLHKKMIKGAYGVEIKTGMSILDCVRDKRHNEGIKGNLDKAFEGENIDNVIWVNADQTSWDIKCNPIIGSSNQIVGATVFATDVTEKIKTEEDLKLSEAKYRTIFENVQDVFFQSDLSGAIIEISPSCEKLLEVSREAAMGRPGSSFYYDPKDRERFTQELLQKGSVNDFMTRLNSNQATEKYISVSAHLVLNDDGSTKYIEGVIRDVTDRVISEEALRLSEIKYRTIFENIQDIFFQTDLSGTILEVTPSVTKYLKYSREELLGAAVTKLYVDPQDRDVYREILIKNLEVNDFVTRFKTGDNGIKYVSINSNLILDSNGNPQYIQGVLRDVTDRKINEMKIEEQNKTLQFQNKELEQFAYITSHDLQEPLLTLKHFSEVLKEELEENTDEDIHQYLDFITQSSTRMQVLVRGLLEYSRIGNDRDITEVDFNQVLQEVQHDLSSVINETKTQIVVDDLPQIQSVTSEMKQLFGHLIFNAIKFRKQDRIPEIKIAATEQQNNWLFTVKDNGIGIDETDKDKIFTIFKRLNNRDDFEGTGIGLSHCKKIVELNGGTIWVNSNLGEGSAFNFIIPKTYTL